MTDYEKTYKTFKLKVPGYFNFGFDVVDKWADKDKNKLALIIANQNGNKAQKITFSDLKFKSDRFANFLGKLGIKKGDRVFIMLPKVPEWYECLIGMFKTGVIPMPATILCTPKDIEYRINRAEAVAAITDAENAWKVEGVRSRCNSLKWLILIDKKKRGWVDYKGEIKKMPVRIRKKAKTKSSDELILYFTSGTTSYPKMVIHTVSYAIAHQITAKFWQDLKPTDLHWTITDTGWAKAAWGCLFGQWAVGATVFLHNFKGKFNPKLTLKLLERYKISTFCAPPTAYRMFVLENLKKYDFEYLRHCISAGEPLNPEVIEEWEQGTGLKIYDGYGQTETVNVLANFRCIPIKPGSMGKPVPGFKISIVDSKGRELPSGKEGHIAVKVKPERPPGLFKEYWKSPEKMREVFRGEWYYTGDRGYRDKESYFWFVSRADDVITSAGYRIGPFEIESALIEHPAVAEAAAVGAPDRLRGEVVKAFVVLAPDYKPSVKLTKELQEHVKEVTAPYKYPRVIEYVEQLPKTISGKILRRVLKEREWKSYKG
jgi:acyl-coenzyme A synthetase/AMP-(fatty) acid ligase